MLDYTKDPICSIPVHVPFLLRRARARVRYPLPDPTSRIFVAY